MATPVRDPDFEELEEDFFRRGDALAEEGRRPVSFDDLDEPDDPRPAARRAAPVPVRAADAGPAYASGAVQPARPGRRGAFAVGGGFLLLAAIGIAIPNPSGESESVAASPTVAPRTTSAAPPLPWMTTAPRPAAPQPPALPAAEPVEAEPVERSEPRQVIDKLAKKSIKKPANKTGKISKSVKKTAKRTAKKTVKKTVKKPAAKARRTSSRPVFPYWRR